MTQRKIALNLNPSKVYGFRAADLNVLKYLVFNFILPFFFEKQQKDAYLKNEVKEFYMDRVRPHLIQNKISSSLFEKYSTVLLSYSTHSINVMWYIYRINISISTFIMYNT